MTQQTSLPVQQAQAASQAAEAVAQTQAPETGIYKEALQRLPLQRKLSVGAADDPLEHEADDMANKVMRKCAHCEEEERMQRKPLASFIQKKSAGTGDMVTSDAVSDGINATRGGGSSLPDNTRSFMEDRFGADFSGVKIHTAPYAAQLSRDINAQAFTVGNDIYFNEGRFSPGSGDSDHLLAHELTHVLQQNGGNMVQRAEVDDRSCAGLTDIDSDVNAKVRAEISAARTSAGMPIAPAAVPGFLRDVMIRLGGGAVSPIEHFIESLPASKRNLPGSNLAGTKYENVGSVNNFYHLQTLGLAHVVGSSALVHGICIGADKLGHFFEEGFLYFQIANMPGNSVTDAQSAGRAFEIGIQGLGATGVYSNADQAANLSGMQFYTNLMADPSGLTFDIATYVTDKWNEQSNPSFYGSAEATVVWGNLLRGGWNGTFLPAGATSPIDLTGTLSVSGTNVVSGAYRWPSTGPSTPGTISNGVITQRTTAVSGTIPGTPTVSATPVSGITIDFDWAEGRRTGKGTFHSVNEQTLEGSYGFGTSRTNGGAWRMTKI